MFINDIIKKTMIGELCDVRTLREIRISTQQITDTGLYPYYSGFHTRRGYSDHFNIDIEGLESAVILSRVLVGDHCSISFVQSRAYYSHSYAIRSRDESILRNKFLYIYLKYIAKDQIRTLYTGVAQRNISRTALLNYVINVPPMEVQNQIIHAFDTYQANMDHLNEQIAAIQIQFPEHISLLINHQND